MLPEDDNTLLCVPPSLAAEIEAAASEDNRPASDLVRDAIEGYLKNRRWSRLAAYGRDRARELGLLEEDVPRLIAESRIERRQAGR